MQFAAKTPGTVDTLSPRIVPEFSPTGSYGADRQLITAILAAGYVQRNWWLVRTVVWSKRPEVQYIFVSTGLRKLLLAYGEKRGDHPEILRRARRLLIQPKDSSPHADHFHVRIYCAPEDKKNGCRNTGRIWDWVSAS